MGIHGGATSPMRTILLPLDDGSQQPDEPAGAVPENFLAIDRALHVLIRPARGRGQERPTGPKGRSRQGAPESCRCPVSGAAAPAVNPHPSKETKITMKISTV